MATRGFEFVGNLGGTNATPVIVDFTLGVAAAHKVGDAMKIQADGYIDQVAGSIDEITCIMMEAVAAADITAGTTTAKAAIVTSDQVWRCSSDASTAATAVAWAVKTLDTVDANTIDADDVSNGSLMPVGTGGLDSDGNLIIHVVFCETTVGTHVTA
ncbi:MAG: hypothetical protein IPH82_30165 [Chloroflexi bacterium]|nr:hypothetical protein [Chloroflexota bacterium]